MEGDEKIELVLGRVAMLRVKISDVVGPGNCRGAKSEKDGVDEDTVNSLFAIQDSVYYLEKELASLKDLHQCQKYEWEAALAKLDHSRMKLLHELEEYTGEDLEVVREAAIIATETDPTLFPNLFPVNDKYTPSHFHSNNKLSKNGLAVDLSPENTQESEPKHLVQPGRQSKQKVLRFVLGLIAKSAISFVAITSILSLAGFKPEIRKRETSINLLELLPKTAGGKREASIQCPPGKVLVLEDGKARCIVKERVVIPFGSDSDNPNINFAFG